MSSFSKSKYVHGLHVNNNPILKNQKIKTVALNSYGYDKVFEKGNHQNSNTSDGNNLRYMNVPSTDKLYQNSSNVYMNNQNSQNIQNTQISQNVQNIQNIHNIHHIQNFHNIHANVNLNVTANSNSFRQMGMLGIKKFKTTKSSPEKFQNERNFSGDKSKILVQNFMKNSVSNSLNNINKNSTSSNNHAPIEEQNEISYNVLDFIAKKLIKKTETSYKSTNVGFLNTTNPVNTQAHNLMLGKFIPSFQKSSQKNNSEDLHKLSKDNSHYTVGINSNTKLNLTKSNSNINDDKVAININISEEKSETIVATGSGAGSKITNPSPRYDNKVKKYQNETDVKNSNNNNLKNIQGNTSNNLLKSSLNNNLNRNSSKISTNQVKKTTNLLNEINNYNNHFYQGNRTPKNYENINKNLKINCTTTPVTNKNSRKNSLEKSTIKNILKNIGGVGSMTSVTGFIDSTCGNIKAISIGYTNTNTNSNNTNSSINTTIGHSKPKSSGKLGSTTSSNYVTNTSNMSNNNSAGTLTSNSTGKLNIVLTNNTNLHNNKTNYEEINLVTENNKKLQKSINKTGSNSNSLTGSQNFSNNMKIFDKNNPNCMKKKGSVNSSVPMTNQNSKINSKSNSKSASRKDEKNETVRKKIVESESRKINSVVNNMCAPVTVNNNTKLNNPNVNNNINSLNVNIKEKLNYKKHLTSTNSPTHFPFNFNKENTIKQIKSNSKDTVEKNSINSLVKPKNDSIVPVKNKSAALSLKLNLSNNIAGISSSNSENVNFKDNISRKNHNKYIKEKSNISPRKTEIPTDHCAYNKENFDMSIENLLDNSTSSVKSSVRESNYYKKEAAKVSNFIKQFYTNNNEYPTTNLKFYKFGRLLGRGAFGKVNLCLHIVSGRLVALKSFNKNQVLSESAKRKIFHETNIMKTLKHNSIVKIFEVLESSKYILIVMEFICGGDLLSFVRKRTKLNETTAKFIFRQIIEALQYIHSRDVIHRDIKLDNILIDLGNNIKICDFGVSRILRNGDVMHDQCGTPAYIAPEILKNCGYEGFGVDIWSAGVVLYAMLSGTVPFKATNMSDLHRIILSGSYSPIKDISSEATDLLSKILEIDPKKRFTIEQILNHEWLRSTDDIFNGKSKMNLNLFTNAERILLSKTNIDYRSAAKDDLIEVFTLKNLDTNQESENQNVNTKSFILAPFNSSIKNTQEILHPALKIENDVLKFYGKAKENNRNYELNNNGEIDNGILINPQLPNINPENPNTEESKVNKLSKSIIPDGPDKYSLVPSKKESKHVSKPTSPPEFNNKNSDIPSPNEDSHRNARKKDLTSNANTFVLGIYFIKK